MNEITDHLGQNYKTIKDMCDHWGIPYKVYYCRLKLKWSVEKALTTPAVEHKNSITDHYNHTFSSAREMCEYWNVSYRAVISRLRRGYSIKDALEKSPDPRTAKQNQIINDHLGNTFPSVSAMCKYWNIPYSLYKSRIKSNWSVKNALTIPVGELVSYVEDHLKQKYKTLKEMCEHWGIPYDSYMLRIKQSWSVEKALTTPIINRDHAITDHRGQTFSNIKGMCAHWGINEATYRYRLRKGYSMKDALETPIQIKTILHDDIIKDPLNQEFPTTKEMCEHWNVNYTTYCNRLSNGYSMIEALGIIDLITNSTKNHKITPNLTIIKHIDGEKGYFLCHLDNNEIVMQHDQIIEHYKSNLLSE